MPTDAFPIDTAQLVAMFMANIFYGILVFLDGCLKPLSKINIKMLIPAIFMFVFATLDVALGLQHNIEAFVSFQGDPIEEFTDASNWINVVKMVNYVAQTFIGDGILLYRCWIVYGKNWLVIIFPVLIWLGGTACGIMTTYVEATLSHNPNLLNAPNVVPFITGMLSLTLAMNLITTSLIIRRIWLIQRAVKYQTSHVAEGRPLFKVMRVLIESGLMYTISIVVLVGLYIASNNGQFGVSDSVVQIIGITFNLIITRVDRGYATQPVSHSTSANAHPLHAIHIQTNISRYHDPTVASITEPPEAKHTHGWK
ncbi:hypothetical protein DXG01_004308 [Tephrocybe rancida]|nr:hypothetical protein DXG01_004308 [Tephrocybe rancida]